MERTELALNERQSRALGPGPAHRAAMNMNDVSTTTQSTTLSK